MSPPPSVTICKIKGLERMAPGVPPTSDLTPMGASLCICLPGALSWGPRDLSLFPPHRMDTGERKASGNVAPRAREKLPRERERAESCFFPHCGEKRNEAYTAAEYLGLVSTGVTVQEPVGGCARTQGAQRRTPQRRVKPFRVCDS